ncbi:50S ribosomal protein L7/L12 [Candidatus Roizmanbacteria bacterium]|nr:50S ribosomal protein L7/L12 [Candidatus Roizmanbacteria bacterium]
MADEQKTDTKVSPKLEKMLKEIEGMTVLELADLVKALEVKFGVAAIAAAPPAAGAATSSGAGDAGAKPAEEQTVFNVTLKGDGGKKIQVLKVVRELVPTLTLLDAKKLVESLPKDVLTQVNKQTAEEAKKKLETAGGQVELK